MSTLKGIVEHQWKQTPKETRERQSPEDSGSLRDRGCCRSFVGAGNEDMDSLDQDV